MLLCPLKFYLTHFICLSIVAYTIVSSSNGKLFLLIAASEFKEHKNALLARASPRAPPGELNYSIPQTSGF